MKELIVLTLATLVGTLLALEAKAWLPYLGNRLLTFAIKRFPSEIDEATRVRWEKEIQADFHDFDDRPLGGFAFAFRVFLKGGRDLAAELALGEKVSEGEEKQRVLAEESEGSGLSALQLATLFRSLRKWATLVDGPTFEASITYLIVRLAESFDEVEAEELRLRIADGLAHHAAGFAAMYEEEGITAAEVKRLAARLREGGGAKDG